jgi:pimeloyl-ACP methyl ester carboxylesterase
VGSRHHSDDDSGTSHSVDQQCDIALVCIHGLAGSSAWWNPVAAKLEEAGPVRLLDLPRRVHPPDLAGWVVEQLNRSQIFGPVDLVGHSLGALVALRVAAARPELVRRLVLIAPPGITPRGFTIAFGWPLIVSLSRARPRFLVRLARDASRAGPANILRGARHVAGADARLDAEQVVAPTLLVWGASDRLVPSTSADRWLEVLPDARLHVIPTASHVPMVEAPDELAAVISEFRNER